MTRNVELPLRHKNLDKRPAPAIYMESFLAAGELKAKDVDFHYAKATPDRFAALVSGGVDAAILYPPATFRAASQGFTYLGDITDHLKSSPVCRLCRQHRLGGEKSPGHARIRQGLQPRPPLGLRHQ